MKKVLTILVILSLFAGVAFAGVAAADNKSVVLTTTVEKSTPTFSLGAKDGDDFVDAKTVDITSADVEVEFRVYQDTVARLASDTPVTLTVTCEPFYYYGAKGTSAKNTGVGSGAATTSVTGAGLGNAEVGDRENLSFDAATDVTTATNKAVFTPRYDGKVEAGEIGRFKATWKKVDDLPYGVYKADITLSYEPL